VVGSWGEKNVDKVYSGKDMGTHSDDVRRNGFRGRCSNASP
jgi:hypothetical protein